MMMFVIFCILMNEILPIKYIIGSWFLKVIKVCMCVYDLNIFFLCVFIRVWLFKDLERMCNHFKALSFSDLYANYQGLS